MAKILISGGEPLPAKSPISGAKNAVLPILAACLLADGPVAIGNVPHLHDVTTFIELLGRMGVQLVLDDRMKIACRPDHHRPLRGAVRPGQAPCAPRSWCWGRWWRASARRRCRCPAAARSARARSTSISAACRRWAPTSPCENGYIRARAERLKGARIVMDMVTVTGTENIMMAAALAKGTTIIENAAQEPEVVDLANCLNAMGAQIEGAGTATMVIHGVERLHGADYDVLPDRIETGTFLVGAAHDRRQGAQPAMRAPTPCDAVLAKLEEAGAHVSTGRGLDRAGHARSPPRAVNIITAPYPAFPDRHAGSVHRTQLRGRRRRA